MRQWLTYQGKAVLFVGDYPLRLVLGRTPLGKPLVNLWPMMRTWLRDFARQWKISPDNLPEVINQLNCGQGAEVVNEDGESVRLWVHPQEPSMGAEPLLKREVAQLPERDYLKIALDQTKRQFGPGVDQEERDLLARSLVRQWERYDGHACIFLDQWAEIAFHLTEREGGCDVHVVRRGTDLGRLLLSAGVAAKEIEETITKLNLGQEIEFRDPRGIRGRLWSDPKAKRICTRPIDPRPGVPGAPPAPPSPPIFCPKCKAVLKIWQPGQQEQACPMCGGVVSLR